jgi:SIR2-like domain
MGIPIKEIVAKFMERDCVLLLGPGLAIDKQGGPLQCGLINYFKANQLEIEEDMDNLYSCKKAQVKTRAYGYLKEYYRNHCEPNELHRQLARIPCHLYVSINPDLLMKQALEYYGVDHEFKCYVKGHPPEDVATPSPENPLLYNLFGSIDNQQSIILTHEDLIQYMFSIIKEFKLPQNLRNSMESSHYYIFLGFDFEKWYLRLLLKLFLDENKLSIASEAGSRTQDRLRTFYSGNYGLEFVDNNIEDYIKGVYEECSQQGLLRPIKEKTQTSIQEQIRAFIKSDEVDKAIDHLYQFIEKMDEQTFKEKAEDKQELLDELDLHSAKLNRSVKSLRKQEITEEVASIEKVQIINAVQTIARMVDP